MNEWMNIKEGRRREKKEIMNERRNEMKVETIVMWQK